MTVKKTNRTIYMMTTAMITMMMMKRKGKTFIPVRVTNLTLLRTISIHNHEKKSVMRIYLIHQMTTKGIMLCSLISFITFSQLCSVTKYIEISVEKLFFWILGLKGLK